MKASTVKSIFGFSFAVLNMAIAPGVFVSGWRWFVVPWLKIPAPGYLTALMILMVLGALFGRLKKDDGEDIVATTVARTILLLITWVIMLIAHFVSG